MLLLRLRGGMEGELGLILHLKCLYSTYSCDGETVIIRFIRDALSVYRLCGLHCYFKRNFDV